MRILLASVGSLGDVHPYLAIGGALRARGHTVGLLTNPELADTVTAAGLTFMSAGDGVNLAAASASPNLWHPIKGLGVLWKHMLAPAIQPTFDAIARWSADGPSTVLATPFMFGARLAREKMDTINLLSLYPAPSLLRTGQAPLTVADRRIPRGTPRSAMRLVWHLLDRIKLEPMARATLDRLALQLGVATPLPAPLLGRWMHSPDGGIALFPEWFAPRKDDWPQARLEFSGFPLYDEVPALSAPLQAFLAQGDAPIVFAPGTVMQHAEGFFEAAVQACAILGRRGVLLTPHAAQVPRSLPANVCHEPYASFASLLPQSAALVHHGGIGTCAQALRAGLPQVTVPRAHDQFDNGVRLETLNVGRLIKPSLLDGIRLAALLKRLLDDPASLAARTACRERLTASALPTICDLVERMGHR